jgi:serine/threonine protein kinase
MFWRSMTLRECPILTRNSSDYLRQKGQPGLAEPEVSRLVSQIVDGVQFFQKNNLVHRDIKLQNILLDKDNNVKFTDFGLATKLSSRQVEI